MDVGVQGHRIVVEQIPVKQQRTLRWLVLVESTVAWRVGKVLADLEVKRVVGDIDHPNSLVRINVVPFIHQLAGLEVAVENHFATQALVARIRLPEHPVGGEHFETE